MATQYSGLFTLSQQMQAVTASNWPIILPSDPSFEYTTLLLNGDGANGGQNNTFLDSSGNNFTITRNGNTTQGSFSPYGSLWSNYLPGSGSYISAASNAAFGYGTGDFEISFWFYKQNSGDAFLIDQRTSDNQAAVCLYITSNTVRLYVSGADRITSATTELNTWYYLTLSRVSGTTRLFLNGSQTGSSYTDSTNYINSPVVFGIRGVDLSSSPLQGYISNARIVKGSGVSTQTVPTVPLTAISGTSLLTCQSNRFIDNSTNAFTITVAGTVSVQRFSPFEPDAPYSTALIGGSAYSGGSGNDLNTSTNIALGTNNFTLEGWFYLTAYGSVMFGTAAYNGASNSDFGAYLFCDNSYLIGNFYSGSSASGTILASPLTLRQWNHVAYVRSGSSFALFVNGTRVGTATSSNSVNSKPVFVCGSGTTNPAPAGYYTNTRLVNGTAVYSPSSTTITVPTAPLTAVANTVFLANMTNASIADLAMQNNLETVGNAQVSTSVKKYGTGSLYFDGSGDYLKSNSATSDLYAFGTGDFTIEMWAYFNVVNADQSLYDGRPTGTNGAYQHIYLEGATGKILYQANTNTQITSGSSLSASTWYHIALSRSGTSTKLFINGTQSGSTYTDSSNYTVASGRPFIGINASNTSVFNLNGYIDDLRVTKGIARYTTNFTPPTAALPIY